MRLVELELVALLAAIDLEAPASVLEVLASTRGLHDTVQRHELGYDDPSHLDPPSRSLSPKTARAGETHHPVRPRQSASEA